LRLQALHLGDNYATEEYGAYEVHDAAPANDQDQNLEAASFTGGERYMGVLGGGVTTTAQSDIPAGVHGAGGGGLSVGGDGSGKSGSEGGGGEDGGGVSLGGSGGGEARSSWSAQAEVADMSSHAGVLLGPDGEQKRERLKEHTQYSGRRQRCEKFFGEQMDVWEGGGGQRAEEDDTFQHDTFQHDTFQRDDALARLLLSASGLAMHQVLLK
jgi:hypothetical protein